MIAAERLTSSMMPPSLWPMHNTDLCPCKPHVRRLLTAHTWHAGATIHGHRACWSRRELAGWKEQHERSSMQLSREKVQKFKAVISAAPS